MHVLIIPSWYPNDDNPVSGVFFREQALAVSEFGIKTGIVSPQLRSLRVFLKSKRRRVGFDIYDDFQLKTYKFYDWNWSCCFSRLRQRHWLRIGEKLFKKYIRKEGIPDLIHAHCSLLGGVLACRLKDRYGIPFIITEHSSEFARGLVDSFDRQLCSEVFDKASAKISVSQSLAQTLAREFNSTAGSWICIPNLLGSRFEMIAQNSGLKIENFVQKREGKTGFRFLNIALSTDIKGQNYLIDAFAIVSKEFKDAELVIGGDGPARAKLEKEVRRQGLQESILFLGALSRSQVLEQMMTSDVFVLSSNYETFGIVLIEALACGKPIISTCCGGPESIVENHNGILVMSRDPHELSKAMIYAKENMSDYDADTIRSGCLDKFGKAAVVNQIKDIYSLVLGSDF